MHRWRIQAFWHSCKNFSRVDRFILRPTFALLCYILLQTNNQVKTYITRKESHRSSVLKTINDYALLTNAFSVQTTADFFACAQSCLGDSQCMSVNFHRLPNNGLCEMSKDYIDGQMEECTRLYYRKGSVFGQLVNVSVSGCMVRWMVIQWSIYP